MSLKIVVPLLHTREFKQMFKKKISIVALAVVLLSGVATFGQWRWFVGAYPSVTETQSDKLAYWLALVDLESQPVSVRRELIDRLQTELNQGWSPLSDGQDEAGADLDRYQLVIADNIEILTRDWFYYRCEQYEGINQPQQRLEFVGPQVNTVLLWADIYSQVQNHGQQASEQNAFELFDKLDGWIDEADSEQRDALTRGIHHSVLYWLGANSVDELALETRRELAERIAAALGGGAGSSAELLELTSRHQQQLQANAFSLVEVWLLNRALEFVELSPARQEAYLDKQLETVKDWELEKVLAGGSQNTAAGSQMQLVQLMGNLAVWAERAPEEHRASYKILTSSLRQYALKKVLKLQ